ncbi:uncharacterized protein LOC110981843 [Acanthaster planci]|uniref:Uncharacterized protein LOC110981843 n=1 Tax=Acanthaster planci TaxID=133434 RepID=A0A8B7YSR1_ACAPL|nr:uncharacterized protein LOC110981843 [Acanthaster planci]
MPIQKTSGDLRGSLDFENDSSDEWDDTLQGTDVICITPPIGYKPKARAGHNQVYLSKMILQRMNRLSGPRESQRAREVFRRYEERRQAARQMLKQSSRSSPPSRSFRSHIQNEIDYSSDFTEDEDDASCFGCVSRRSVAKETSSGGEEVLTSSDEELHFLMAESDKRIKRSPSVGDAEKHSRRGGGQKGKSARTAAEGTAKENMLDDGRHFNLPHDRPLDPWRLPPIDNLSKKGPVNLVKKPPANPDPTSEGLATTSVSDQQLMKSLRVRERKFKKLARKKKNKKQYAEKK